VDCVNETAEELAEVIAVLNARRDRKVEAQRKEIVRLLDTNKRLGQELHEALERNKSTEPYKENQSLRLTIEVQRKALQERQDYIDDVKRKLRGLASDGDKFQ